MSTRRRPILAASSSSHTLRLTEPRSAALVVPSSATSLRQRHNWLDTCGPQCYLAAVRSQWLKDVSRIVVKLGTGVLTDSRKQPDFAQMEQLAAQIAAQRKAGKDVVVVSSGAVGAGMGVLGLSKRPNDLAELQACAAVGQSRLMAIYEKLLAEFDLRVAQVLLTHDDLQHHERHLNARNTLVTLLAHGVVPIINENDAISFTELKFGDNDKLSALVASLLPADLLVILTTVDGVIENFGKANPKTIPTIESIDAQIESLAGGTDSATAVGGMASKVEAAKIVVRSGIPLVIASGRKKQALARVVAGEVEGTLFVPQPAKLQGRKRWIAFFHHPKGALFVDEGARKALRENGKSLLPPGVARCEGEFDAGEVVRICDLNGTEFARGIAEFNSGEITARQLKRVEVVHRDNLVIL
jgi:glutamate 5-kinase